MKMSGSTLIAKRRHCAVLQSHLTRTREQNHSFAHVSCASYCWLVISGHGHDVIMDVSVLSVCGHRELRWLVSSPPCWWIWQERLDAVVHDLNGLSQTCSPVSANGGLPTTRARLCGQGSDWRAACSERHVKLDRLPASVLMQRCGTTKEVSEDCMSTLPMKTVHKSN